jgi:O-antigen ligase
MGLLEKNYMKLSDVAGNASRLRDIVWALLLASLPVTSFPFFPPALGGAVLVRPLAIYPLLVLLLVATLPALYRRRLPVAFIPLAAFILVAMAGVALASLSGLEAWRGVSLLERGIRGLLTLFVGVALYFTITLLVRNREGLKFSLRWLYAGFVVALSWGTLQAINVIWYTDAYFEFLSRMQAFISTRRLFPRRVSGMTFEPNWFAEQIGLLLLPWLMAAVFSGQSIFRWRYRKITVEALLLGWAVVILIFTYSRAGLIIFASLLVLSVLFILPWRVLPSFTETSKTRLQGLYQRLGAIILLLTILAGSLFVLGGQNNYFARLWRYWTDPEATGDYLSYIAFSQRFTYWEAAFGMYSDHALLGVGLGNYSFYFQEHLPDQPLYQYPELLRHFVPGEERDRLVTPKNLHVKILAETGLAGLATYLTFLLVLVGYVVYLWARPDPEPAFWGKAGMLGLVAYVMVSFSSDSFATPNMWVFFGLITAAALVYSGGAKGQASELGAGSRQ